LSETKSYFENSINYDNPKWVYYLASSSADIYYTNNFSVINEVPTETLFCYADKGQLNHSNDPTYISYNKVTTAPTQIFYNLNFSHNYNVFYVSLF
jgi:hypothetical protein